MPANFHEGFSSSDVKPPSERATGLVFAVVAVIVAIVYRQSDLVPWIALAISLALVAVSLTAPLLLTPLNILWFRFGLLLHRIVNPLVMLILFSVVFVPAGWLMRLWRDPLRSRRQVQTYWVERGSDEGQKQSMVNQY